MQYKIYVFINSFMNTMQLKVSGCKKHSRHIVKSFKDMCINQLKLSMH